MITEDYVSFEIAKLLKEKGFDKAVLITDWWYDAEGQAHKRGNYSYGGAPFYDKETCFNCPTLQMAIKWLNDVHHILVVSDYEYEFTDTSWYFKVYRLGDNGKPERVPVKGVSYDDSGEHEHIVGYRDYERSYKDYTTREEAEEGGIRYVLENLI